jgi:hypothetical protein
LSTEGQHTITFFSTDKAGNAEVAQTATVKIDKTAPTISHSFTPLSYQNGAWTNKDVTVTFDLRRPGRLWSRELHRSGHQERRGRVHGHRHGDGRSGQLRDGQRQRADRQDRPTITATATGIKNAAGWYNGDVTVSYTANDDASGVSGTPASDVLGQGANQSASATVTDAAGNSASVTVGGINVDKTDPVLTGSFPSGWHTGDVTVAWTCTDALSGPAGQPADTKVTGEGANLSATASCSDVAGNTVTKTVTGIKIDRSAPTTTAKVADPNGAGWYGDAVQVTLNASDNLSGIASTKYSVDGGAAQNYTGAFSFGTEGTHTIAFWSTTTPATSRPPELRSR